MPSGCGSSNEVLIELLPVVAFQNLQNAVGRKRLLIRAMRSHGVVDVGNAAQHGGDVQRRPRDAMRVPRAVEPQMVFEGDNRSERRDFRRAPKDFCAIDDVALHDDELLVRQLVRLVQDVERRSDLADVMHERRQTELRSSAPSMPIARACPMVRIETLTMCVNV